MPKRYRKFLTSLSLLALAAGCRTTSQADSSSREFVGLYKINARELENMVERDHGVDQLAEQARKLIMLAEPLVHDYGAANPECQAYLRATLDAAQSMQDLSLDQLRESYGEGRALPKAPAFCQSAQELVVRPATIVVLAKDQRVTPQNKRMIKEEIKEALQHLDEVGQRL